MKNNTETKIIITMKHVDNADRFARQLRRFCKVADEGGDVRLMISHNGTIKDCGYVAHDLGVGSIEHEVSTGP